MIQTITQKLFARPRFTAPPAAPIAASWAPLDDPLVDVVIPCLDEEATLARNVTYLHRYLTTGLPWRFRITIADSGSTDDTRAVAERLARLHANVSVRHEPVRGRGRALRNAWLAGASGTAGREAADILVYMDEDLSTDPSHLRDLIAPLVSGDAPVAIGSRRHRDARVRRGLKREVISRGYILLIRSLLGLRVSDAQCGFKAVRADAARRVVPHVADDGWFFDTELLWRASRLGWPIHEVGVRWQEDPDSRVHLITTAAADLKGIFRLRAETDTVRLRERVAFIGLLAGTALLYLWNLGINGLANSYYAAAVQAGSVSWHAFFYAALDSVGWVSVDKPPVAVWVSAVSARLFGFSSFSMLLPHALAGIATVAIVYLIVRRYFSAGAGLLAGATMALTPAAALMFRFNNPDSILTLLLAAGAYTFLRGVETGRLRWLLGTGVLIGTAFNTKMIQALIILPVLGIVYLVAAKPKLLTRIWQLLAAGGAVAVSALWWPVIVWLTPASARPYVGSTSDNSIWSLIFGYNGLSRFLGGQGQAGGGGMRGATGGGMGGFGGGMGGPGNAAGGMMNNTGFGGSTGILRMFNDSFGPNIAWLIPLALLGAAAVIWWTWRERRTNMKRAVVLLALGWLLIHAAVFSVTGGTIHPYYVVVMAPAVAILVGAGVPFLRACYVSGRWTAALLPLAVFLGGVTAFVLFGYDSTWMTYLKWPALIGGVGASVLLALNLLSPRRRLQAIGFAVAAVSVGFGPASYALATVSVAHTGSIPTAGLASTAMSGSNNETATADSALVSYLLANQGSAAWIAATDSANSSAGIQIASGQPVMALGGFNGSDDTVTLAQFKALVKAGKVKYYVVESGIGGRSFGGASRGTSDGMGFGGFGGRTSGISEITSWITTNAQTVTVGGSDNVTVYDLSSIS